MPKALALPGYPNTYQVILLALGCVLGVPLLFPASLLKIIVAAIVVVTRVVASAPASTSGSKLLWHKEGKRSKVPCEERRKSVICILFKHISGTETCWSTGFWPISFCSPKVYSLEDNMAPGPPGTAGVKISWEVLRLEVLRGFLVSSPAIMISKRTTSRKPG